MRPLESSRSNSKSVKAQLQKIAIKASGAAKTRVARRGKMGTFADYLKSNNIQITHAEQIKVKYIVSYIAYRKSLGIKDRTLQNDMASIRKTLVSMGREKLAYSEKMSNKALGISGASREGKKVAISNAQYQVIYEKALLKSPALATAIELARTLGLRGEEAVQSIHSLKTWQTALSNGATKLHVVFGTKGGRPRETTVIDRERTIHAVNNALAIAQQQGGKLINKPNLKQAMTYWRNSCRAIGLVGKISPHSLRYAYAQDGMEYYQAQGYSGKEIYALISMDLGHGDGRGCYIKQVYSKRK